MALQKNIELASNLGVNVSFTGAYIKVGNIKGNKDNISFTYDILDQKNGKVLTTKATFFEPDLNGSNFIQQAYSHLKTLEEFTDAVDC